MATQMRGINLVRKGTASGERALGAELRAGRGGVGCSYAERRRQKAPETTPWTPAEPNPRVSRKTHLPSGLRSRVPSGLSGVPTPGCPGRQRGREEGAQMGRAGGTTGRLQRNQAGTQTWTGLKASSRESESGQSAALMSSPARPALPDASCSEAPAGKQP